MKKKILIFGGTLTNSKMSQKIASDDTIRKAIENMHPIPKLTKVKILEIYLVSFLSEKNIWNSG